MTDKQQAGVAVEQAVHGTSQRVKTTREEQNLLDLAAELEIVAGPRRISCLAELKPNAVESSFDRYVTVRRWSLKFGRVDLRFRPSTLLPAWRQRVLPA